MEKTRMELYNPTIEKIKAEVIVYDLNVDKKNGEE